MTDKQRLAVCRVLRGAEQLLHVVQRRNQAEWQLAVQLERDLKEASAAMCNVCPELPTCGIPEEPWVPQKD